MEGALPQVRHRVGDADTPEGAAASESQVADGGHRVWDAQDLQSLLSASKPTQTGLAVSGYSQSVGDWKFDAIWTKVAKKGRTQTMTLHDLQDRAHSPRAIT